MGSALVYSPGEAAGVAIRTGRAIRTRAPRRRHARARAVHKRVRGGREGKGGEVSRKLCRNKLALLLSLARAHLVPQLVHELENVAVQRPRGALARARAGQRLQRRVRECGKHGRHDERRAHLARRGGVRELVASSAGARSKRRAARGGEAG